MLPKHIGGAAAVAFCMLSLHHAAHADECRLERIISAEDAAGKKVGRKRGGGRFHKVST